jgi:hypothetical protein
MGSVGSVGGRRWSMTTKGRVHNVIRSSTHPITHIIVVDDLSIELGEAIDTVDELLDDEVISSVELWRGAPTPCDNTIPILSTFRGNGCNILVPTSTYRNMSTYLGRVGVECALLGRAVPSKDGWTLEEVVLPEQWASIGTITITTDGVMRAHGELGYFNYYIHKHLHNPEPSRTDLEMWEELGEMCNPFLVSIVDVHGRSISYIYGYGSRRDANIVLVAGDSTVPNLARVDSTIKERVVEVLYGYMGREDVV